MVLIVKCKRCGHDQKYDPKPGSLADKKKVCVYCGFAIPVRDHIVSKI